MEILWTEQVCRYLLFIKTLYTYIVGEPDVDPRQIPEDVIQDIWRFQRFQAKRLNTTEGQSVAVANPGRLNSDQGPDFVGARIELDGTTWVGSVEIHRQSSEWFSHGHHRDPIYNSVVLHVTLIADRNTGKLRRSDGSQVPEVVLYPRLDQSLRQLTWEHASRLGRPFPCHRHWPHVPANVIGPLLSRLARARIGKRIKRLEDRFLAVPDLNQILYEEVFRSLGYTPNAESMVLVARRVPFALACSLESRFDHQCLLLGTAGLLPRHDDYLRSDRSAVEYAIKVTERYNELNARLGIEEMTRATWRFSRMRPSNFPSLRLAQAAAVFGPGGPLSVDPIGRVAEAMLADDANHAVTSLLAAKPESFWQHHVDLSRRLEKPRDGLIGPDRRVTVAVNAFVPCVAFLGEQLDRPDVSEAALHGLERLPFASDRVTRHYTRPLPRPRTALQAQAIHELAGSWCSHGRCKDCEVGRHLSEIGCRFAS